MNFAPIVIIDTREQTPWMFENLCSERATLATADYTIKGLTHRVGIERKELSDLLACCGHGRDRFVRELERLAAFPFRCVIIEATLTDLEAGNWRSKLRATHVLGSIASWATKYGLPFFFCDGHEQAGRFAERWLFQAARHIAQEHQAAIGITEGAA